MEIDRIRNLAIPPHLRHGFGHVPTSFYLSMTRTLSSSSLTAMHTSLSDPRSENRMFILGMGFVGQLLAQKLQNQGWVVSGTCTSHVKKKKLEEKGFHIYQFDANEPELGILDRLKHHTHLLVSIPPMVGIGDPMLQHEELLRSSLVNGDLQWLCYLSSTSIYGDCGGELVDEDYPTNPTSELAKLRLASEEGWSNLAHYLGFSPYIFRLGGIYGPGRSAIDTIINEGPLSERQKMRKYRKYTSRVHVEDICQALTAAAYAPSSGKVYNIVDDDPAPREQVFEYARKLVEKKWPSFILPQPEEMEWSNEKSRNPRDEKRVCNDRMKKELGVRLLYPHYRSGLQNILDQLDTPLSKL
ncbi:Protein yeeZ [Senna tora]|uniref:Protein yeeZ n=1 Tax=Senna tora TaxID=362788 RepID=A0A834T8F8_9FABA|nr:Protein yeeZ [Senna tora]